MKICIYSISPYAYCANNPINAIDLNGDSIWYTIDKDVVTMHVTGKIIDSSSDGINVNRAASDIASGISDVFSGVFKFEGQTYTLQTDVQLDVVSSMDDVMDSDHLFVLRDADGQSARGAVNMLGGKVLNLASSDYTNDNWFSNTFFSNNIQTALHEFGHALHGLLSDVTYASLSGTNVYRDFVELPSQFNENYLSEKEFLDSFAVHYKTGEKIPVELVEKIKKSSQYLAAYSCVRQLTFGNLDMAYHTITAPVDDAIAFEKAAIDKTLVLPDVEGTLIAPQFSHIFSGGYAAGYYGYKWAEVLDADAFSVFKANGIFDPVTATSFRDNILKRGGTENPMILYKRFKGSEPTIDALMRRDGIIK